MQEVLNLLENHMYVVVIAVISLAVLANSLIRAVTSILDTQTKERSRREIAAYIAEGSLTPEQGDRLVFGEVKTRRGDTMGGAIEALPKRKAQRLLLAAEAFGQQHDDLPPGRRIDLIAIDLDADGRVASIEHIEGAVEES